MSFHYLLEDGSGALLLENGLGYYILENANYLIRVQAVAAGFSGGLYRNIGDIFDVDIGGFSDSTIATVPPGNPDYPLYGWMLQVPDATPLFSFAASGLSTPRNAPRRTIL
jgi:hypothetical protein